ncbi:hypothetical protein FZEAL_377 [Fusarium zealandicum]|uniref:Altered inheritance of mitochondria protein 11 n=1 Tax=Fusarium zealandicum TaxID=1053134 RepID=A0A8H4UVA2_9HYPO|nr:hypothetical protein FZEAL_377 [Fusarium zealandicum]
MASSFAAMPDTASTPVAQDNPDKTTPPPPAPPTYSPWVRQARQMGLLFAGAGFMAASIAIARRSVLRRRIDSLPRFYTGNRSPAKFDSADRSLLAASALGLATLNVMSFAVFLVGGISWSFDLCSIRELSVRSQAAVRRQGVVDPEDEEKMEAMMEDLMARMGMDKPEPSETPSEHVNKD